MGRNLLLLAGAGVLAAVAWVLLAGNGRRAPSPAATTVSVDGPPDTPLVSQHPANARIAPTATDRDEATSTASEAELSPLAAEFEHFTHWQSPAAAQARQRIVSRGSAVLPEIIAALRSASDAAAAIDIADRSADRDALQALLMRQNHLLMTVAAIGGDEATDAILDTSGRMSADSPLRGSIYAALDAMGDAARADQHALDVIGNPDSRSIELATALARFWLGTPPEAGEKLAQHFDADSSQVRALAYNLAVNLDRDSEVRPYLLREIAGMQYARPGNKQILMALAETEQTAQFVARLDALRLRPTVRKAVQTYSEFLAADASTRETMLGTMLHSSDSELWAQAVQHMLEAGRLDLLARHQLLYIPGDPFRAYDQYVPGFSRMTRDQRLTYLSAAELDRIEASAADTPPIIFGAGMERVLRRLGYSATRRGFDISLTKVAP